MIHRSGSRNGTSVAGPVPANTSTVIASWGPPSWAAHTRMIPAESLLAYSTEPVVVPVSDLGEFRITLEQDDTIDSANGRFTVTRNQATVKVEWQSGAEFPCHVADALGQMTVTEASAYATVISDLVAVAREHGGDR